MRAAVVSQIGSPPAPAGWDEPSRGAGQALVEVRAASLNPVEVRVAAGRHPQRARPPYVPGLEGAGVVLESSRLAPGTRVRFEGNLPGFGSHGTLAERVSVPEETLVELPDGAGDDMAAAIGVVGITALLALDRAALTGGERVLVLGATGAVGQMAVQLARLMGARRVVAAGRNQEALERALELGADASVAVDGDFAEAAGGPLDVVVDPLWGEPAMAALRALGTGGRLVNVGQSAGVDVQIPLALVRNKQGAIHAISSGWTEPDRKADAYRRLIAHVAAGHLQVPRLVVPLEEIAAAWERQAASPGRKLVIDIRNEG
jgi:NADPH2:quinone reductase